MKYQWTATYSEGAYTRSFVATSAVHAADVALTLEKDDNPNSPNETTQLVRGPKLEEPRP